MSNEMNQQPRKRGPMGRMGRGMQPGEKPKDLKKSIKQLAQYIGKYKIAIFIAQRCSTLPDQRFSEKLRPHCPRD